MNEIQSSLVLDDPKKVVNLLELDVPMKPNLYGMLRRSKAYQRAAFRMP